MLHCSARDEVVLHTFLGSGTTVTASERIGRRSFGVELDPASVDTIIRRRQAPIDGTARPAATGRTFDDLAREAEAANVV
jgi:DNA modification methylase